MKKAIKIILPVITGVVFILGVLFIARTACADTAIMGMPTLAPFDSISLPDMRIEVKDTIHWQPSTEKAYITALRATRGATKGKTEFRSGNDYDEKKEHGLKWSDTYVIFGDKIYMRHYHKWHKLDEKTSYWEASWHE